MQDKQHHECYNMNESIRRYIMKIEIWSDFACPFCYIGKTRFEEALSQFEHKDQVEVLYKAYQLNPNAPKVADAPAHVMFAKSHGMSEADAKEKFKMITGMAKQAGLTYHYDKLQMTNTFDAHRLAKLASEKGIEDKLTSVLMKAYFTDGLNLADFDTLVTLVTSVGLDEKEVKEVLESSKYGDTVQNQITEGRTIGVQGVPFFVINRKYGVSGAQQTDYFLQALRQIWAEENPLQTMGEGETCSDEGECAF